MSNTMQKKRFTVLWLITIFIAVGLLGFYFVATAAGEDKTDDAEKTEAQAAENAEEEKAAIPVRAQTIETGHMASYISATANLVPESEVKVLAEWEGRLARLEVEEGDRIKAGQVLATLADDDAEILFQKAKIRASTAQLAFDRGSRLKNQELISSEEYDKVVLDHEIALHELEEAEWRLEKTRILAPFEGVVTERNAQLGQHVRPGDELFSVADFTPLIARIYLPEKDVLALDEGRDVRIALKADTSIDFRGRIRQISPVVDTATGTVKVTVETRNPPKIVRPGAFVRVDIVREARDAAVVLPREAVVRELTKAYVFVAENGVAAKRAVTLGIEEDGQVEVTSGVAAGEQVIVAGQGGLKDGAAVALIES